MTQSNISEYPKSKVNAEQEGDVNVVAKDIVDED